MSPTERSSLIPPSSPPPNKLAPRALILAESASLASGPPLLQQYLSEKELTELLKEGTRRAIHRGKMVFSQGAPHNGIFLIETGRIRVFYIAPQGREITLAYWYPGNFVGGPELMGQGRHVWSGVAAANSTVIHIPGTALRRLIPRMPGLAFGLIEGLTFKGKCYSALAQMLGTRSVSERLIHLLLHLCDAYGRPEGENIVIGTSLTHADLAHMVGATRQWITISLKRLEAQGVLKAEKSGIVVYGIDRLKNCQQEG